MVRTRSSYGSNIKRLSTPELQKYSLRSLRCRHLRTPHKTKIRTLYYTQHSQCEIVKILAEEDDIKISQSRISKIIREKSARRARNDPQKTDRRGRPTKFSKSQLEDVEKLLEQEEDAKWMEWHELAFITDSVGDLMGNTEWKTFRDAMQKRGWSKRRAVQKDELPQDLAKKRYQRALQLKAERPTKKHWRNVLFTDECHFF